MMKKIFLFFVFCQVLHATVEKPIVVIIPSYNNERYVERNLNSVFDQEYTNYRVIYIDDCSTDKTLAKVHEIVAQRGQEHRTAIIHNEYNRGAMANFYHTIHGYCADDDIVVQLDGDDWFKHTEVLARVNQEYTHQNVWMTYGRCEYYPEGKPDTQKALPATIVARNAYREYEKVPSHLRTFYAGLFKQIALQDFLYEGAFLTMNCDLAIMFPLLEMAHGKVGFIDEIVHVYNCATPLNDYKKDILLQLHLDHVLRSREKYKSAASFFAEPLVFEPDVFILAETPQDAQACQQALECRVGSLGTIQSLSTESSAQDLMTILETCPSDYVFVVDATMLPADSFDSTLCTRALQQTKAQVFCCDRGVVTADGCVQKFVQVHSVQVHSVQVHPVQVHPVQVHDDVYGWQFARGEYSWHKPFGSLAHMYAKKTICHALSRYKKQVKGRAIFDALNDLIIDKDAVGLCCKEQLFKERV